MASVSGSVLAVCLCTVLPLFAGIYRMGAGLGPATASFYARPAVNVMAIILTARVLDFEMGLARAIGAVLFAIVIGLIMQLFFRRSEAERVVPADSPPPDDARPLWKTAVLFGTMVSILVAANWGHGGEPGGPWELIFSLKWYLEGVCGIVLSLIMIRWFAISWVGCLIAAGPVVALARQILPLLLIGVVAAGLLPPDWISSAVGGNSIGPQSFRFCSRRLHVFCYFDRGADSARTSDLFGRRLTMKNRPTSIL